LRADYRTGDNVEGWSVNGGLRYQFVPDLAVRASEPLIAKAPIDKAAPRKPRTIGPVSTSARTLEPTGGTRIGPSRTTAAPPARALPVYLAAAKSATTIRPENGCSASRATRARAMPAGRGHARPVSSTTAKSIPIGLQRRLLGSDMPIGTGSWCTRRAEQQSRRTEPRARVTPFRSPRFRLLA